MKSAQTIVYLMSEEMPFKLNPDIVPYIIEAMKLYANEKLDEAAKKAKYKYIEINGHLGSSIIEDSILSLKNQI